jgi:FHA domain
MARPADAGRAARAQHEASQPAWLESSTGQRILLPTDSRKLTVGRDPDSDIMLDDPDVSRWHAVLLRNGSEWLIDDIGSTNGTYVNGSRITARTILHTGDAMELGNASFTFHQRGATHGRDSEASGVRGSQSRSPRKQRSALRRAIIAALVLWVIGLLAASLNTYFSKLEGTWQWLLPNVVSGVVVVIGAVVNHVSSSGQQTEQAEDGGQPPFARSPVPPTRTAPSLTGVLAILLVLGIGALAVTVGVRYAVGYFTGGETPVAERLVGKPRGSGGGVDLTVNRIYETDHYTRVEVTALNHSTIPKSLPLGPFCTLSGPGTTLESDALKSQWPTVHARGVQQHGTITFSGHLSGAAQSATLSFSFGPDQPQVRGIKLKARP